jgi:pSer/pThr/pTyr-binding forkhead associated (FHA) protein
MPAGQGLDSPPPAPSAPPIPPPPTPSVRPAAVSSFEPPPFPSTSQPIVEEDDDEIPIQYRTQIQQQTARLLHVQTSTVIELPQGLNLIHLGKPNDRIPADVDLSGFPNSEIVSRIHADIRVEGDLYYLEDVGSSNGTYVNNTVLPPGNRHRLRPGDRIALGKGDKMTFLFQLA